jgi:hypothetical protein
LGGGTPSNIQTFNFGDATQRGRGCLVLCGTTPNEVFLDWDGGAFAGKTLDEAVQSGKNFLSSTGILSIRIPKFCEKFSIACAGSSTATVQYVQDQ